MNGIVIKEQDYKESSKIIYIFTKFGLNGYKLLNVKNKKSMVVGNFITGNVINFNYTSSDFPTILDANIIKSNLDITKDISQIESLRMMIEVIKYIQNENVNEKIYDFIEKSFINLSLYNPKKVLSIFLIKLLFVFGVNPNFKSCVLCNNTNDLVSFSVKDGGAICKKCTSNHNEMYEYWQEYYYKKDEISNYNDCDFDKLLKQISDYYLINCHINLKLRLL